MKNEWLKLKLKNKEEGVEDIKIALHPFQSFIVKRREGWIDNYYQ